MHNDNHDYSDSEIREYQNWFQSFSFRLFVTLTFPALETAPRMLPLSAQKRIAVFMRDASKATRRALGSLGMVIAGHSGHLHAHMLVLDSKNRDFDDADIKTIENCWPHLCDVRRSDGDERIVRYLASEKHMNWSAACDFFSYGIKALEKAQKADRANPTPKNVHNNLPTWSAQ